MFNDKQLQTLNQEIDSNRIKTREKGNIQLSYLEGFDVIETANRIFGFGNWSYNVTSLEQVSQEKNQNQNNIVCYKAIVKVLVHNEEHTKSVIREDVGFGSGIAKTLADSFEGGAKEAVTDGLKRCLKSFGNQLGLSLYDKTKNHNNNKQQANNTQNYLQPQYKSQNQPTQNNIPQDYSQLTNIGLAVVQQGQNLIVTGTNIFANKDIIKKYGFRWDGANKLWYKVLENMVA